MEQLFAFIMGSLFGAGIASVFLRPTVVNLPPPPIYEYKSTKVTKTTQSDSKDKQ